jgi:hypothetical protein
MMSQALRASVRCASSAERFRPPSVTRRRSKSRTMSLSALAVSRLLPIGVFNSCATPATSAPKRRHFFGRLQIGLGLVQRLHHLGHIVAGLFDFTLLALEFRQAQFQSAPGQRLAPVRHQQQGDQRADDDAGRADHQHRQLRAAVTRAGAALEAHDPVALADRQHRLRRQPRHQRRALLMRLGLAVAVVQQRVGACGRRRAALEAAILDAHVQVLQQRRIDHLAHQGIDAEHNRDKTDQRRAPLRRCLQRHAVAVHRRAGDEARLAAGVLHQRDALGGDDLAAVAPQLQRLQVRRQGRQVQAEGVLVALSAARCIRRGNAAAHAGGMDMEIRIAFRRDAGIALDRLGEGRQLRVRHRAHKLQGLETGIARSTFSSVTNG